MSALEANVLEFCRLLRRAGLALGVADGMTALAALEHVDLAERASVQAALRCTLARRQEEIFLFDAAFELFFRGKNPALGSQIAPALRKGPKPGSRRLAEAAGASKRLAQAGAPETTQEGADAREKLHAMDFEAMSAEVLARAKAELKTLELPLRARRTRRWRRARRGYTDFPATLRQSLREGGELTRIAHRQRIRRPPPLVVLCDISGSMARYAQIFLHFLHGAAQRQQAEVFLFGTRLTRITRQLRHRDAELAFALVAALVPDWSGGTRIGAALEQFNRFWGRRVLGQNATVLLITDGLERDLEGGGGVAQLARNIARLHGTCRRLIWLNPLLRWQGFSPRAAGPKAMLPHVDEFRPVHNLDSLKTLIASLAGPPAPRLTAQEAWKDFL